MTAASVSAGTRRPRPGDQRIGFSRITSATRPRKGGVDTCSRAGGGRGVHDLVPQSVRHRYEPNTCSGLRRARLMNEVEHSTPRAMRGPSHLGQRRLPIAAMDPTDGTNAECDLAPIPTQLAIRRDMFHVKHHREGQNGVCNGTLTLRRHRPRTTRGAGDTASRRHPRCGDHCRSTRSSVRARLPRNRPTCPGARPFRE